MPTQPALNPLLLSKLGLWIAMVAIATILLRRRQITKEVRLAFLIGGVLVFGLAYGWLTRGGLNPNPVNSVRTLLKGLLVRGQLLPPLAAMLAILLALAFVSNKSICGWGCQLGLLQGLLHRVPLPKWHPPFWLSNSVRIAAFGALIAGLVTAGLDWIGIIDPFQLFSFHLTWGIGLFALGLLGASLFLYRPWCRFLCPFGLLSWAVEQKSLFRPRVNPEACKACQVCVKACPSGAMADFYDGKRLHADCFACGACIEACPQEEALGWRAKS